MRDSVLSIIEEMRDALCEMRDEELEVALQTLASAKRIFCLAAGRSKMILSTFCLRLRHLGFDAHMLGDLYCPPVEIGDLLFVASGSGNTTSVLALSKKCKEIQADILVCTANLDSPLAKLGKRVVFVPSTSSLAFVQGEQVMRSLFEQVLFILCEALVKELAATLEPSIISGRHANVE